MTSQADWLREVNVDPGKYPRGGSEDTPRGPVTAMEIMEMDLPEPKWVIEDVLPVGVTLLAGKPKKGKSWMGLGMCEYGAAGGKAFGLKDVRQGEALYLALGDNLRRLKKRLKKVLDGRQPPEGMRFEVAWPRMDQGEAERLDAYLSDNPRTVLVVIDTLTKIRKSTQGRSIYADDYEALKPLLPLAQKHGVAIVVTSS